MSSNVYIHCQIAPALLNLHPFPQSCPDIVTVQTTQQFYILIIVVFTLQNPRNLALFEFFLCLLCLMVKVQMKGVNFSIWYILCHFFPFLKRNTKEKSKHWSTYIALYINRRNGLLGFELCGEVVMAT